MDSPKIPYTLAELAADIATGDLCSERVMATLQAYDRLATDILKDNLDDNHITSLVTLLSAGVFAGTGMPEKIIAMLGAQIVPVLFKLSVGLALTEGYVFTTKRSSK